LAWNRKFRVAYALLELERKLGGIEIYGKRDPSETTIGQLSRCLARFRTTARYFLLVVVLKTAVSNAKSGAGKIPAARHGATIAEIAGTFIHASSSFADDEWAGFEKGAGQDTKVLGIQISDAFEDLKLYRTGNYP